MTAASSRDAEIMLPSKLKTYPVRLASGLPEASDSKELWRFVFKVYLRNPLR